MMVDSCQWQEPDDYCFNLVEGRTNYCARHNRLLRKIEQDEKKASEKRKVALQKVKEKEAKVREALNGTLPKSEYPFMIHKPKRIKKVSDKRKELNKEYFTLVEQFKKDNPHCKAKVNDYCTGKTDDPHHSKGRGKYLLDVSTWIPVCRSCHIWIDNNHKEAGAKGLIFSRLATTEPHKI